jgi:hypothetical protein
MLWRRAPQAEIHRRVKEPAFFFAASIKAGVTASPQALQRPAPA